MASSNRKKNDPEEVEESHGFIIEKPNLNGDWLNFSILTILYVIQGVPIGLVAGFSVILQSKKTVTFGDQALLSIAQWPFFMKIFWAPIVDAFYIQRIGRRKSWLLFLQLLMGLTLLYLASNIDNWLPESGNPNPKMISFVIFFVNILSATQDIVVDGWSLTILKKRNLNYAAAGNSIGFAAGMFIGSTCFTLLVSEQFSNLYLNTSPGTGGLITMKNFLSVCGIVTISFTILVGLFKKEKDNRLDDSSPKINVLQNYKLLWDILKLPRIKILALALLTMKVGVSATDNASKFKLIDAGVSKDAIMIIDTAAIVIKFVLPFIVFKYATKEKPMSLNLKITPFRLLWAGIYALFIYYTPSLIHKNGIVDVPIYYYCILIFVVEINEIFRCCLFLTVQSFFCRLSDPRFGGTYMTLFNTLYLLGFLLSNTIILKLIQISTFSVEISYSFFTSYLRTLCRTNEGICEVYVDGYYVTVIICMVFGFVWLGIFKNKLRSYQLLDPSYWVINVNSSYAGEGESNELNKLSATYQSTEFSVFNGEL